MPTVRTYGTRQVTTAPIPGVRVSPEAGGTATSEGAGVHQAEAQQFGQLAQVGEQVAKIGEQAFARQQEEQRRQLEEARRRAIELNVIEGENKLAAWQRDRLYDPQKGALTVKGKAAMPLPEQIDGEFEKAASDAAAGMATPEAKLAFERVVASRRQQVGLEIRQHVDREIQTYTATETKARVQNAIDSAIRVGTTPDANGRLDLHAAAAELSAGEAAFRSQATVLGLGPEQQAEQVQAMHTQVHEGIINQLVADGKIDAARSYFAEAKDDIDPQRKDDIQKTLQAGTVKKQAQTQTEKILAEGGTLEEQRAKAKKIDDPDVQDEVIQRLEHEAAVADRQETEAHRETLRGIADIIDKTKSVTSVPSTDWAKLSPGERSAFHSYAKQLVDKGDVETDLHTYYGHLQAAAHDPLTWATKTNLERDIHKLGKAEFKQLAELQSNILGGALKKADAQLTGFLTTNQVVQNAFGKAGLDTTPKPGTPEATAFYTIQREIDKQVAAKREARGGKELSAQEVQGIADEMLTNVTLQRGTWLGLLTTAPFSDVQKRLGEVTIADMPADLRRQAEDSLRRAGETVSDGTVLALYRKYLLKQQREGQK